MSSRSVDSRRILQSKLSPPGARPPCSMIVCNETRQLNNAYRFIRVFSELKAEIKSFAHGLVLRTSFKRKLFLLLILIRALLSLLCVLCVLSIDYAQRDWWCFLNDCTERVFRTFHIDMLRSFIIRYNHARPPLKTNSQNGQAY